MAVRKATPKSARHKYPKSSSKSFAAREVVRVARPASDPLERITALDRISRAFGARRLKPATFFIGAAVEDRMASEIWQMLNAGALTNAANLTNGDQLSSICNWLCSL